MDPFRNPPADSLAAARLHVQALTECGLSREALLRALLEDYEPSEGLFFLWCLVFHLVSNSNVTNENGELIMQQIPML
jgi:hypothetical protein